MKAFRAIAAGAVALVTALAGCSAPTTPTPSASSSEPAKSTRALRVWAGSTTPITIDFNPFHSIAHHIERPLRIHHPGLTDAEIPQPHCRPARTGLARPRGPGDSRSTTPLHCLAT